MIRYLVSNDAFVSPLHTNVPRYLHELRYLVTLENLDPLECFVQNIDVDLNNVEYVRTVLYVFDVLERSIALCS